MASLNQVQLIGNCGKDAEVRRLQSGDPVASFSIATSEQWNDKSSGEKRERTEWHNVVIFGRGESGGLASIAEKYCKKGTRVFVQGKMKTRSWEKDGIKHYSTEVVLNGFDGQLILLGSPTGSRPAAEPGSYGAEAPAAKPPLSEELEDEIPFLNRWLTLGRPVE